MMSGNPSWCSPASSSQSQPQTSNSLFSTQYHVHGLGSSTSLPFSSLLHDSHQDFPHSWNQLPLGGLADDHEGQRLGLNNFHNKKSEIWQDQAQEQDHEISNRFTFVDIKQEVIQNSNSYRHGDETTTRPVWSQNMLPVSSSRSCVTTTTSFSNNNNLLDFSFHNTDLTTSSTTNQHTSTDLSSECNSTARGGICKKARVHSSSSQPPLKVRKEKLGDRVSTLHQIVSPFGKTDTASVLLEAIGYIRFLQGQIQALSSPYMDTNIRSHQSEDEGKAMDLKSRGLCLVPVECTEVVSNDNGADYWAPAFGGGGF